MHALLETLPFPAIAAFTILIGLILGSFASAMSHRIPHGESWWGRAGATARSKCTSCDMPLKPKDLIPLVSWIINKGKCAHCKASISKRYPIIELASALICLMTLIIHGISIQTAFIIAVTPFMLAHFVIDLDHKILPDQLNIITAAIGLLFIGSQGFLNQDYIPVLNHLGAAFIYAFTAFVLGKTMSIILKKDALGFGDVKFFAVAGLWLGLTALPTFMVISGIAGVAFGIAWQTIKKDPVFPFGPALIISFFITLMIDASFFL